MKNEKPRKFNNKKTIGQTIERKKKQKHSHTYASERINEQTQMKAKKKKNLSHPLDDACQRIKRKEAGRGEGVGGGPQLHL